MVIPLRQEEIVDLVTAMAMETTVIPEQEVRLWISLSKAPW